MKKIKLLVIIALVFIMMLSFTGCGEIKKAETVINNTFTALKSLDFETASDYINVDEIMNSEDEENDALSLDDNVFMENLFGKLEYEIVSSEKIDKNTVVAKTKITAVDMKPVLGEFLGKSLQYALANVFSNPQPSDEEMNQMMEEMFVECVSKEDLAMVTTEVDIKVIKVDKKWKIESADELSDALLGGLTKATEEISNSLDSVNNSF